MSAFSWTTTALCRAPMVGAAGLLAAACLTVAANPFPAQAQTEAGARDGAQGRIQTMTEADQTAPQRIERGNLVLENIPDIPDTLRDRLSQYQNIRPAGLADWTQDGEGLLIRTRFAESAQFHLVSAPLGMRRQITFFDDPVRGGDFAPSGGPNGFLFHKDEGGAERFQLFFFDQTTGQAKRLSDGTGRVESYGWSRDGSVIIWSQSDADNPRRQLFITRSDDLETHRAVFEGEGYWAPADISKDQQQMLIFNYISRNESAIHILDLETGATNRIAPADEPVSYSSPQFTADDKAVLFTSDRGSQFRRIVHYDLATKESTILTPDLDWDVETLTQSQDGSLYAFITNENGLSRLHIRRSADHAALPEPDLPPAIVGSLRFSPDGTRLAMSVNGAAQPSDAWVYDLENGTLTRWTEGEVGGLDTAAFREPDLVTYPTFDMVDGKRRQIPAFFYKPEGDGPFPVVVVIHGGPESQFRPQFRDNFQYWLNELGVAVLAPNVRGSAGYGKDYLLLDNGRLREDSVRDIGALIDWIGTRDDLDADKVVVYGGSYGGYMVLASMVYYSDKLAGGVDIVGISNFVTFLENTSPYRQDLRRSEYGDERDPEMRSFLERISPLTRASEITKPLFVVQGLNDPRVPASEAEQILEAVRANGTMVWYLAATNEGHGFRRRSNQDYLDAAVVMFFQKVLGLQP